MEELLLGQVRGLMILAKAANLRNDQRVYLEYLARANAMLELVEQMRIFQQLRAA